MTIASAGAFAPVVLALAAIGALVLGAAAIGLVLAVGASLSVAARDLRAGRAADRGLDAARDDWYDAVDRVAVVEQVGDEVAANVFPLPRRTSAEVLPFPPRPAA